MVAVQLKRKGYAGKKFKRIFGKDPWDTEYADPFEF
jgi:hypothetical protein